MYSFAIDSVDLFDENDYFIPDADELVSHPERNGFVRVKYHWSEDTTKNEDWYIGQKRGLSKRPFH